MNIQITSNRLPGQCCGTGVFCLPRIKPAIFGISSCCQQINTTPLHRTASATGVFSSAARVLLNRPQLQFGGERPNRLRGTSALAAVGVTPFPLRFLRAEANTCRGAGISPRRNNRQQRDKASAPSPLPATRASTTPCRAFHARQLRRWPHSHPRPASPHAESPRSSWQPRAFLLTMVYESDAECRSPGQFMRARNGSVHDICRDSSGK